MATRKRKAAKPKAAKAAAKPRKLKTDGIVYAIKSHCLRKPMITTAELVEKLRGDGFKSISEATVQTFRQDFLHSLRFLKAKGYDIPGIE